MRILSISPNYNYNSKNVNFGRFADENARKVVRETLTAEPSRDYMQQAYNSWFNAIKTDKNFIAYTSESGTVKGKFDDDFIMRNSDNQYLMLRIKMLKKQGHLEENINELKRLETIASDLKDINDELNGIDVSEKYRSKNPYGDATAKEAEREARIDNLAD